MTYDEEFLHHLAIRDKLEEERRTNVTDQEKEQKYLSGAYGGVARTAFLAGRRSANAELVAALEAVKRANQLFEEPYCGIDPDTEWEKAWAMADAALAALEPKEMKPNA